MQVDICGTRSWEIEILVLSLAHILYGMHTTMEKIISMIGQPINSEDGHNPL